MARRQANIGRGSSPSIQHGYRGGVVLILPIAGGLAHSGRSGEVQAMSAATNVTRLRNHHLSGHYREVFALADMGVRHGRPRSS